MTYCTMADLTGMIPGKFLIEGLDDDGDGAADSAVWDQVATDASTAVDEILGGRYTVPFTNPMPSLVAGAAKVFAAETIYTRRGKVSKENPFFEKAEKLRDQLREVAAGTLALDPALDRAKPSGTIISAPAKTANSSGRLNA